MTPCQPTNLTCLRCLRSVTPSQLRVLPFWTLLVLFFFSGACGLTYQVLWLRQLSLIFGVTVYAASTVLAAFMTGLALGSVLAGRILVRVDRPLVAFGAAEILVGVSALLSPMALDSASTLYASLYRVAPDSLGLLTVARFVCSFGVLLIPTALMGLTLPFLSASVLVRGTAFGSRVSALYAINTAGAVAGVVLTGFSLIGAIGMQRTFLLAASVNVLVGIVACALGRTLDERAVTDPAAVQATTSAADVAWSVGARRAVLAVVMISGLAALALEVVWFRILVQFLPATTYAFTTMLATVLAGIAVGGAVASRVLARPRDWMAWLSLLQIATAVAAVTSMVFLGWSYQAGWRTSGTIQASVAAIFPAALLMGASFPIALRLGMMESPASSGSRAGVARSVGRLYALNVIGAIVGSLAGGFLIVPLFGVRVGLIVLAALYAASGLILVVVRPRTRLVAMSVAGLALFAYAARHTPDPFDAAFVRRHGEDTRELWRHDGPQTAVSVHGGRLRHTLFLDGLHQANDTPEMVRLHRIIGHLPMVLHPDPGAALVIGLGGGATAGAVSRHANASVHIVELSDGVRQAARFFVHVNYDVLNRPNVRLRVDDGRNFLMMTDERFDVVTADIIQPIHAGAGNLYSREYFSLVRQVLRPGGLVMQWIGHRQETQYKLIMRTFLDVFPEATLWFDGHLMIGSLEPLKIARETFESRFQDAGTREALTAAGLADFDTLQSWYTAGPVTLKRFVGEGIVLTDDRPLVEYHRSLPGDDPPVDLSMVRDEEWQRPRGGSPPQN